MFGRRVTATATVAAVTAATSLALYVLGYGLEAMVGLSFIPARVGGLALPPEISSIPVWLTPLGATLIQNPLSLFFTMAMLVFLGARTEEVLGPRLTLLLYAIGAYAAAIAYWLTSPDETFPLFGAYAATAALVGAYAMLYGQFREGATINDRLVRAASLTIVWAVINVALALDPDGGGLRPGWTASIGAFVVGAALALPLLRWRQGRQNSSQRGS
jgi:membrane associated rhomboid family serine protease